MRRLGRGAWIGIVFGVAVGWMAGGCTSLAPRNQTVALPVAAHYPADAVSTPAERGADAAAIGWRDYFSDPRLRALIAQALGNNRDLRSAALHVAEARAAFRIQRSAEWPTLGADAIGIRTLVPAGTLTGEPLLLSEYEVGISELSWELDFWGRVRNLKGSALESYLATDAARRGAAVSLVAQVAIDYLGLRELDERLMLARQTAASREESFRIFKRRFQVGSTSKLDLTQVETLLTQAQGLSAQLEQQRAAQAHGLTLLIGAAADLAPAEGGFDDQSVLSELGAGVPSELLTSRPDIVAAEHQLKAAHANIGAARAAFFPRVTLTGAFGSASADLDGLFGAGSRSWTFLPSISLPIFDSGRNRANLDLAKVRGDLAVANYEKTIQSAFRDVSDALSARRWLTEQVRIQQTMLAAQTERARLAKLRYDNGAAAFLEVLDAQRDLLSVEQQLVQTRCALLSSRVSLYAALGGGSMEFVATPPSHTP
jgi:multidrug efflux system outer membrane protein